MAYRFNGSSDKIIFSGAPLNGHANGSITVAIFLKRSVAGTFDDLVGVYDTGLSATRVVAYTNTSNQLTVARATNGTGGPTMSSTSIWYIAAVTFSGTTYSYHLYNGSTWSHPGAAGTIASSAIGATDKIGVSANVAAGFLAADVVCTGIKKADSTNAAIETLSPTAFSAWQAFGFDWLIGFDTSLQTAGVLQDQATPGTGDETSKTGTSVVGDPPGWTWGATSTFVPQTIVIT